MKADLVHDMIRIARQASVLGLVPLLLVDDVLVHLEVGEKPVL
jgi:hypothetical protein